ncbi:unnamed protein product [Effrenium voratum]|nr:unnamed protein product [Effrenium voratum]
MEPALETEQPTPVVPRSRCPCKGRWSVCRRKRFWAAVAVVVLLCGAIWLGVAQAQATVNNYSEQTAVRLAQLAGAAYCSDASLEAWDCGSKCLPSVQGPVKVCHGETTQAFVAEWEGAALVSFEGTKSYLSMIQDLRIWKNLTDWKSHGKVHDGFLQEWESLRDCVRNALAHHSKLRVTGHSLGGAVSTLAMVDLATEGWNVMGAYTFGMPRAGDAEFARTFDGMFFQKFYRVTHHMDPVPHVPPENLGFSHLASEVFYDGDVSHGFKTCAQAEDESCAGKYWDVVLDLFHVNDHLDYMGQNTGSKGCKALASQPQAAAGAVVV